jgi:hypothetical protein
LDLERDQGKREEGNGGERPRREGIRKWRRECEREKKGEKKRGLGAKKMMAGRDGSKRTERRGEDWRK